MAVDIKWKIGRRIKDLRQKKNMSQKDLAFSSDLDRSYIASVESGQRNISSVNILKIATALNISLKEFFNDKNFENISTNKN